MTHRCLWLLPLAVLGQEPAKEGPAQIVERGRLVCLAEEMKEKWKAEVPPVHDHILGYRTEPAEASKPASYYTLLRTPLSEALFYDDRFRNRPLELTGRVFPGTGILEVTKFRWLKDGKLTDVYYWCEVCSIRGVNPGPCACCQGAVELREAAIPSK